jgi:hypothetical protein
MFFDCFWIFRPRTRSTTQSHSFSPCLARRLIDLQDIYLQDLKRRSPWNLFGKYLQPHWRVSRARSAEATRHVDTSPRDKEEMGAAWLAASSEGGGRVCNTTDEMSVFWKEFPWNQDSIWRISENKQWRKLKLENELGELILFNIFFHNPITGINSLFIGETNATRNKKIDKESIANCCMNATSACVNRPSFRFVCANVAVRNLNSTDRSFCRPCPNFKY